MFRSKRALWAVLILAAIFSTAWAEEKEKAPPAKEPTAADITRWIKQLEFDREAFARGKFDFTSSKQDAAEKKILSAGKAAIPALSRAAVGDNLERTVNSIKILGQFLESDDDDLRASAKEVLEKIANGKNERAAAHAKFAIKTGEISLLRKQPSNVMLDTQEILDVVPHLFRYCSGNRLLIIDRCGDCGLLVSLSDRVRCVILPRIYKAKSIEEFQERYPEIYDLYKKAMLVAKDSPMKPASSQERQAMEAKLKESVKLPARERPEAESIEDLEIVDESLRSMNEVLTWEEITSLMKTDLRILIADLLVQLEIMESCLDRKFDKRELKTEAAEIAPAGEAADEDIARWVEQLCLGNYTERKAAGEKLFSAGEKAIPALSKAATGKNTKTRVRSIGVLQRFLQSANDDLRLAARNSLGDIVVGDNQLVALFAIRALNGKAVEEPPAAAGEKEDGKQKICLPGEFTISDTRQLSVKRRGYLDWEITVYDKEDGRSVGRVIKVKDMEEFEKKYPEIYRDYRKAIRGKIRRDFPSSATLIKRMEFKKQNFVNGFSGRFEGFLGPGDQLLEGGEVAVGLDSIVEAMEYLNEDLPLEKLAPSTEEKMRVWIEELCKQLDIMESRLAAKADTPGK